LLERLAMKTIAVALSMGFALAACSVDEEVEPPASGEDLASELAAVVADRPANVPADFIPTPHGWFHPSCVIQADSELAEEPAPCGYPRFSARGEPIPEQAPAVESESVPPPRIDGWIEYSSSSAYGPLRFLAADWHVPQHPAIQGSQVVYYFPGLESTRYWDTILQPVLGWWGGRWTMASWNCCRNGNIIHSAMVDVYPGDLLHGFMSGTSCSGGICPNWQVVTMDYSRGTSTTLNTISYNEPMDWAVGGTLEAYGIDHCAQLPSNGGVYFENIRAHTVGGADVQEPWTSTVEPVWPNCEWHSGHGTQTVSTLNVATTMNRVAGPTQCGVLWPGQGLNVNQALYSCDGRFSLWMQIDGNLVLYQNGVGALWSTNTSAGKGYAAVMQGDGNFVLYDLARRALWHTWTFNYPGAYLAVQNDGNMVVYSGGRPIWASNTCCR
jgi:hypothetical protein